MQVDMYLEINVNANKFYYKVNVVIMLVNGYQQLHQHKDTVQIINVEVLHHNLHVPKFNHVIGMQQ